MRTLWAVIKAVCFAAMTVGFYLTWLMALPFLLVSGKAARWWRGFIFRTWARAIARLIGMTVTVKGPPPQPPFYLVSNHLSYVDVIVLAAHLDCVFVAKSDIASWPFFGLFSRSFNTIFIDRENRSDILRVNALIEKVMSDGWGVVVFPEGTSTKGESVIPFKPNLLEPAAKAGWPVSYASLSYRTPPDETPAHQAVCWWGEMSFAPHLFGLLHLRGFEATLTFGAEKFQNTDRKLLAGRLHDAVERIFIPVLKTEIECSTETQAMIHRSGQ